MTATPAAPATTSQDDGDGRDSRFYTYPPTGELLDRVTTVISATDAKPWLTSWSGGVSMAWAVDHMTLLATTLRKEGRDAAIALGSEEAERIRLIRAEAGVFVHDMQEALLMWAKSRGGEGAAVALPLLPDHLADALYPMGKDLTGKDVWLPLREVVDIMVDGFIQWVHDFNPRFLAAEMTVFNQPLGIAGTLDALIELTGYAICDDPTCRDYRAHLVARPGNVLVICVDTKTGKNWAGTWKDQLAAYMTMPECMLRSGEIRPMPHTDAGAVLHLRPDYPGGYLLMLVAAADSEAARARFAKRASIYRESQQVKDKPGRVVRPLRPDGTIPGLRVCDLASEGYGHALAPLRKALGADAELEDLARFTPAEVLKIKGIGPKLIETIRIMLADHGLRFADDPTEKAA